MNDIGLSIKQLAQIVNGKLNEAALNNRSKIFFSQGFSTDSRCINAKNVFIGLNGKNFSGSDFVVQAKEKGAILAIVDKEQIVNFPQIIVESPEKALLSIANFWRRSFIYPVIGITGTNGKTSTKEMLAQILNQIAPTLFSQKNFNNQIGVAKTLLNLQSNHRYLVIEMGISEIGEMANLVDCVVPDIGLITNISSAHLTGLKNKQQIIKEKSFIYEKANELVINLDNEYTKNLLDKFLNKKIITIGINNKADITASNIINNGKSFKINYQNNSVIINWQLNGVHNIYNGLCAAAAAILAGANLIDVKNGLDGFYLDNARLVEKKYGIHTIFDDSYNANPASFIAGIDVIKNYPNSLIVAGKMAELGDDSLYWHKKIANYAFKQSIADFWAVGDGEFINAYQQGFLNTNHLTDKKMAAKKIIDLLKKQSNPIAILIKGSRSAFMEEIIQIIDKEYYVL